MAFQSEAAQLTVFTAFDHSGTLGLRSFNRINPLTIEFDELEHELEEVEHELEEASRTSLG